MAKNKMVAYVGTYTSEGEAGLYIYDVDAKERKMILREEIQASNPSYLCISKDEEVLYSIVDEGIAAFKIDKNGGLTHINTEFIGGMRGCHLVTDSQRRYVFIAGFHDGRVSMMRLKKDGSIDGIAYGLFHRGHAISAHERRLDHPKVSSVNLTPDEKFICATDYGLNQMKVYRIDYENGTFELEDTVRCALDSAPRKVRFSNDGRHCYILTESACAVEVYDYCLKDDKPVFELIDRVKVIEDTYVAAAATHMFITDDDKYVFVSIDGMNYVSWLKRDSETGRLEIAGTSPVSGDYPKYICMYPNTNNLIVCNHDSHEIRDFMVNFEEGYMLNHGVPTRSERANCICFKKVKAD